MTTGVDESGPTLLVGDVDGGSLPGDVVPLGRSSACERVADGGVRCVVVAHDPPDVDAPETVAALRERAPVSVVLCGPADGDVVSRALAAGVDEYAPRGGDALAAAVERADGRPDAGVERRENEILERVSDGFFALDASFRVRYVNSAGAEMMQSTPAELEGTVLWDLFPGALGSTFETEYREAMASGEPASFAEYYPPLGAWFEVQAYPSETGLSVYFRDVTERKVREAELETTTRQFEAVLANPVSPVVMLHADGTVFDANEAAVDRVDEDLAALRGIPLWETAWVTGDEATTVRDAVERAIEGERTRFEGTLAADGDRTVDLAVNPVTSEDGSVVGVVVAGRDITERVRYERQVRTQRAQLAAVTRVASVARDVNRALEGMSGRAELEQFVCERLVEGADYSLAWVGRVDAVADTLRPEAAAGDATGYLDDVRIDLGSAAAEPSARAVRTRSMEVVRDVADGATSEPWREVASAHGLGACAAIPITYGETLYGVLNVYAEEPGAFDGSVRPMLGQFDTVLGHAVAAADRRLALTTDRYVELTFDVSTSFLTRAAAAAGGDVSVAGTVSPTDDTTLRYLSVAGDVERVAALAAEEGASVRVVTESPDGVLEVVPESTPIEQRLATHGVVVDDYAATPEGGVLTVRHPAETETRTAVETVQQFLPGASLRAQRATTGSSDPPTAGESLLTEALTDRQRTALETAYYAGYFEWPRESTAAELAAAMDIADPTYHQHLRAAHRNLLTRVFEGRRP
jgi:PAS domain S-box-containing protein